ncbi:hypothetical protein BLNAU_5571 [Blattamonas nauphoetae]|uniref:Uncharacterized protein n=1 Tax=Blattamonas nauphoetae TaxID=2049346 RepID=A0ABQ9Y6Y8_9EUKA|nr:hypothetical protein BLNAU_5571 [Blattamonas nauphoetae]
MSLPFISGSSFIHLLIETDKNNTKTNKCLLHADNASIIAQEELLALNELARDFLPSMHNTKDGMNDSLKRRTMKKSTSQTPSKPSSQHCVTAQ